MTAASIVLTDSLTMSRRNFRRMVRYPSMTLMLVGLPVVFLLLFVYVFGGTLGAGLGGAAEGRTAYVGYLAPGIILFTVAGAVQGTAISVAMDMTEGIIDRFRTMSVSRSAVLAGHVIGSMVQTLLGVVVVLAVALLTGFRPSASAGSWLAAAGLIVLATLALIWLSVALGLAAKSVETASNTPMILMLLPFLGSGFVPTGSMPSGLRWFAEYQPFTAATETLRGLLTGTPVGNNAIVAVAWCAAIAVLGYLWAVRLFERRQPR